MTRAHCLQAQELMLHFQPPQRLYRVESNLWSTAPKAQGAAESSAPTTDAAEAPAAAAAPLGAAAAVDAPDASAAAAAPLDASTTATAPEASPAATSEGVARAQQAGTDPTEPTQGAATVATVNPLATGGPGNRPHARQAADSSPRRPTDTAGVLERPPLAAASHKSDQKDPLAVVIRDSAADSAEAQPYARNGVDRDTDPLAEQDNKESPSAAEQRKLGDRGGSPQGVTRVLWADHVGVHPNALELSMFADVAMY
jgi:hypothetical protein